MQIIDYQCRVVITDNDTLIDDGSIKCIVSPYEEENMVYITMGDTSGKRSYILTKKAAKELAKALEAKSC